MSEQFERVTREEVRRDYLAVHEFIEYLRWLAESDCTFELTIGQVWQMFDLGVRWGLTWDEAAEKTGLPENDNWL